MQVPQKLIPAETEPLEEAVGADARLQDDAARLLKLIEVLDENEDVQNVYANFDISEEVMAALRGALLGTALVLVLRPPGAAVLALAPSPTTSRHHHTTR